MQYSKLAIKISVVSLLVSIGSVSVQYFQKAYQFEKKIEENLHIRIDSLDDYPIKVNKEQYNVNSSFPVYINMPWKVTLTNNGYNSLAIMDYKIINTNVRKNVVKQEGKIVKRLNDDPKQSNMLPQKIKPSDPISYLVYFPCLISARKIMYLKDNISGNITIDKSRIYLARYGEDFVGNKISFQVNKNGRFHELVRLNDKVNLPEILFSFETARGNVFKKIVKENYIISQ